MSAVSDQVFEKGLPSNPEAERMILGAIVLNGETFPNVYGSIEPGHFSLEKNRRIFARMSDLHERGEKIDRITLVNELQRQKQLESVDGLSYVASLDEGLPQLSNLDSYIRIVKDKALLRQTMIACQTIFDQCAVAQEPSEEILDAATAILERVREKQGLGKSTWTTPYEVVQRGGPALLIPERGAAIGLKTPWSRLTRMTSGWNPGDLVIIAGRPGAGKSVVAMQQAHTTALEGGGVAYVSLEMGKESLTRRLVTGISRVDAHEARSGFLNSEEKRRMLEAANDLELLPLFIDDTRTHTPAAVGAALRRLRARTNVRLVIIDHLQLMGLSGRAESRHHELSEICHGFKRLAGQMECVVMLLSQLNRSSDKEKRRPNLSNSDLKETGSIEEDADVVGLLHRPEMLNRSDQSLRGQAELIIAKQRSGPTGLIKLRFLDRFQVFEPAADREDEAE